MSNTFFEPGSIITSVAATTRRDKQHSRLSPSALHSMARDANGPESVRLIIEHDSRIPPMGKGLFARVETMPDGHLRLISVNEVFADPVEVLLPNGSVGLLQQSEHDQRPFIRRETVSQDEMVVETDSVNFENQEGALDFFTSVRAAGDARVALGGIGRKSLIPDPEIVIHLIGTLAFALAGTALGRKIIDKVGDKVSETIADDLDKFYKTVRSAALAGARNFIPKNRPVTYVLVASGDPQITFVAKTTDPQLIIAATHIDVLDAALTGVYDLHQRFHASEITYILSESGKWEFGFLLTQTGQVIGTKQTFDRRAQMLTNLAEAVQARAGETEQIEQTEQKEVTCPEVAPITSPTQDSASSKKQVLGRQQ